jgi:hypothetical protein
VKGLVGSSTTQVRSLYGTHLASHAFNEGWD